MKRAFFASLTTVVAALGLVSANAQSVLRAHFAGIDNLAKREDAKTLLSVWQLKQTQAFRSEALDKLAKRLGDDVADHRIFKAIPAVEAVWEAQEAHRARLMVSFDESREAELDREIERQSQNATQLFRACEKTLKRVATFGGDAADDSERKVRANVQRSVAVRIQALNTEFRRAQKDYVVRLKSWAASSQPSTCPSQRWRGR